MTSREAVDAVVRAAGTSRAGHAGTLDPLATGVLVVCVGWTTRLVPYVQQLRKTYRAEFLLGRTSDTDDVTGAVQTVAGAHAPEQANIAAALPAFVGRIRQVPPRHSAVHVDGRRAYALARQGIVVNLAPRDVDVFQLEILQYDFPRLELRIGCGSGTYVRSLGRDLGSMLGCGAVMNRLERTAIGPFLIAGAMSPHELTKENIGRHFLPPIAAVGHLPRYDCPAESMSDLLQGRRLAISPDFPLPAQRQMAIAAPDGRLAAIAEFEADELVLRPRQVFLQPAAIR